MLLFIYNIKAQKIPQYTDVNICGQEGMAYKYYFQDGNGGVKYLNIIKEFEKQFKNNNKAYSDYYRMYTFLNYKNPTDLFITLIPKSIVSEEQKKAKDYRVFSDKRILEVSYDLKTKKISKPKPSLILPDL